MLLYNIFFWHKMLLLRGWKVIWKVQWFMTLMSYSEGFVFWGVWCAVSACRLESVFRGSFSNHGLWCVFCRSWLSPSVSSLAVPAPQPSSHSLIAVCLAAQLPGAEAGAVHQRPPFQLHLYQVRPHGEVLRHGKCGRVGQPLGRGWAGVCPVLLQVSSSAALSSLENFVSFRVKLCPLIRLCRICLNFQLQLTFSITLVSGVRHRG